MRWILLVFGVIGIAAAVQEGWRRAEELPAKPCAALAADGADGKIELTEFLFRTKAATTGDRVWVPAVPFGQGHETAAVRVIVELHEKSDLGLAAERDTIRGTVTPATDAMKAAYPGVLWVLREDRALASWGMIALYVCVGVVAVVLFSRLRPSPKPSTTSAP